MERWRTLIAKGATDSLTGARPSYSNEDYGYWARFGTGTRERYWNAFGDFMQDKIVVEINPPRHGPPKGSQGLFATDRAGKRWILHGGRIHPGEHRVDAAQFAQLSGLAPKDVLFSDGSSRPYFLVAPLDGTAGAFHAGIIAFIERCAYVRTRVLLGSDEADIEQAIREAERPSRPEKGGTYVIPPRTEVFANRTHADVWQTLAANLAKRGIKHSNARVGRYGPDLRTLEAPHILFEIKTAMSAQTVYESLGQLLAYERILKKAYTKVLIAPQAPAVLLGDVLEEFGIRFLQYTTTGTRHSFKRAQLDAILRPAARLLRGASPVG